MRFSYTGGQDKDFIFLCGLLDNYLAEIAGAEKQAPYNQYNTLENIHDVIVAYEDDVPAGCASFKQYDRNTAEVKRVFVREEYRGRGIAKELMKRIEARAKEKGFKKLILETGELLVEAHGLYLQLGFCVMENYGQYKDMPESVCMKKEI